MKVTFNIEIGDAYFERTVDMPAAPAVDDAVLIVGEDNGWNERVQRVWWDIDTASASVELGKTFDAHGEGLADTLRNHGGWTEPYPRRSSTETSEG